jgi:hypothetical protein
MNDQVVCEGCRQIIGDDQERRPLLGRPYHVNCWDERKREMIERQKPVKAMDDIERQQLQGRMVKGENGVDRDALLKDIQGVLREANRKGWGS